MVSPEIFGKSREDYDQRALEQTRTLCQELRRTMAVASALLDAGRVVDLRGLDNGVGLVCARSLDLEPNLGPSMRPELLALLERADALAKILQARLASL